MIVLGISETHCATAAILRDGAIVGCASEERFTRLKNDAGYPRLAVEALLRDAGLEASQIDLVALAGRRAYAREWMNRVLHDGEYARQYYGVRLDEPPEQHHRGRLPIAEVPGHGVGIDIASIGRAVAGVEDQHAQAIAGSGCAERKPRAPALRGGPCGDRIAALNGCHLPRSTAPREKDAGAAGPCDYHRLGSGANRGIRRAIQGA